MQVPHLFSIQDILQQIHMLHIVIFIKKINSNSQEAHFHSGHCQVQ